MANLTRNCSYIEKEIVEMDASAVLEMIPSFFQSSCPGIDVVTGNKTKEEIAVVPQHGQSPSESQSLVEEVDDHHTVAKIPAEEWSKHLNKLPAFTEAMIDDHLIYKSSTMPDKKYGYRLFKEGYVQKLFVKADVKIRDSAKLLVRLQLP